MYASLGKIQKIIIFDKLSQQSDGIEPNSFDLYWELINYYIDFCNELPGNHPVDIHVLFDTNFIKSEYPLYWLGETKKIQPPHNKDATLYFHCTNIHDQENEITSIWVQDIIIPVSNTKWFYRSDQIKYHGLSKSDCISNSVLRYLQRVFPDIEMVEMEKRCDGGNILMGKHNKNDYLIIGWGANHTEFSTDQDIRKMFSNESLRIFRVPEVQDSIVEKLVHLDMYLTIIGPPVVPLYPESELLFIGLAEGANSEIVAQFNDALQKCADYLVAQQSPVYFHVVRIPLLIIQIRDEFFALSYNNCHVENVEEDNGRRSIHIYFPDYRIQLDEMALSYSREKKPELLALRYEVHNILPPANHLAKPFDATNLSEATEKFNVLSPDQQEAFALNTSTEIKRLIKTTENKLVKMCTDLGFDGVHFISANLFNLSKSNRGSLHCMSLVVERQLKL